MSFPSDLDPALCLASDPVIQTRHGAVRDLATRLRAEASDDVDFARRAFEWVRDEIRHSLDVNDPRMTLTASEVLSAGVGLCYAKSHLLAAVLRAGGVPTALSYQRLREGEMYMVHGLVAVHLHGGWHRQDPRGNKPGVDARFSLDDECLAWPVDPAAGEVDYPRLFVEPAPSVVAALSTGEDVVAFVRAGGLPSAL